MPTSPALGRLVPRMMWRGVSSLLKGNIVNSCVDGISGDLFEIDPASLRKAILPEEERLAICHVRTNLIILVVDHVVGFAGGREIDQRPVFVDWPTKRSAGNLGNAVQTTS